MGLTPFFPLKDKKGWFIKPRVAYRCNFFPKDELFHKKLVNAIMGFCTGCVTLSLIWDTTPCFLELTSPGE